MKWIIFIAFIGCLVNALNISKKVNAYDDESEESTNGITEIKVDVPWNRKEQTIWMVASAIFLILFIIMLINK